MGSWIALTVALALGIWLLRRLAFGYPAPARPYRRLGRGEAAFLDGAAEALYPPGGDIPCSGREAELPAYVDRLLDASQPRIRWMIHLLFLFVEHATLVWPAPGAGGRRRFSSLSTEQQAQALEAWSARRWLFARLVFTSLRALLTLGYFAHPAVLRPLRLAPLAVDTPVCEADLWYPPIGRGPEAIAYGPEDLTAPSEGVPLDPRGPIDPRYAGGPP